PTAAAERLRPPLAVAAPGRRDARYRGAGMTSGKKARQQRTPPPPPVRSTGGRKASPKVLAIGATVIAVAAVAAALAFALTGNGSGSTSTSSGPPTKLPDAAASVRIFRGVPQLVNVLGMPHAPVTMVEYI